MADRMGVVEAWLTGWVGGVADRMGGVEAWLTGWEGLEA